MDTLSPTNSSTTASVNAPLRQMGNVRQPVSCEPCRRRKIKCSRTRPPCDTCRRRQCADKCVYKGDREEASSAALNPQNQELLDRISNLETLLKKHCGAQQIPLPAKESSYTVPMLSPPVESSQPSHLSPESLASECSSSNPSYLSEGAGSRGVGVLASSSDGNVRYEPQSSQWTSVLANTGLSIATPSLEDSEDSSASLGFPFISSSVPSMDELLSILPPTQQCDYLKNTYFTVFSPLFHILHDPSFHAQYADFLDDPSSVPVSWLAILFILLSLAVTALEESDPVLRDLARGQDACNNIKLLSRRYREAAMKCLARQGVFWGRHNLQSLQALIMLVYAMSHSQDPTWVLLGMTYNVAIALACHIDPENFNLDLIQSEERRRCWAGLMMLYTIQNTVLGNPDPSWRVTYNVNLPADVNDTDITPTEIHHDTLSGPTQMSYLLFKFRLYDLTATICREIFLSSAPEPSHSAIQALDHQICSAQEMWDRKYLSDSSSTATEALPTHHAVHLHILHAYAHQLFLLLHRPFFAQSILGLDVPNASQIRCIASAEALLDIYRILTDTPAFRPYMWYTHGLASFHTFHAAAVLAVALLMPIYRPQYSRFKLILHETLGRFEAVGRRSRICERAAGILRFLLSSPSPNQPASIISPEDENNYSMPQRDDWLGPDQLQLFADRLQPQQWLGPASVSWNEWDNLMNHMDGIRA